MNAGFNSAVQVLWQLPVDLVSTTELAFYLRCSRKSVERMVARGKIRPIRIGRVWRFDREQVIEALGDTPTAA